MIPQNFEESTDESKEDENSIPQADGTESDSNGNRRRLRSVLYAILAIPVLYVVAGLFCRGIVDSADLYAGETDRASSIKNSRYTNRLIYHETQARFFLSMLQHQGALSGLPSDAGATTSLTSNNANTATATFPLAIFEQLSDTKGRVFRFALRRNTYDAEWQIVSIEESMDGIEWLPSKMPMPARSAQACANQLLSKIGHQMGETAAKMVDGVSSSAGIPPTEK